MHKLHTAAGPSRASFSDLRNGISRTSTIVPLTAVGESSPMGIMPWSPLFGFPAQATTLLEWNCIQVHIAGAPPSLAMISSAFGGL